MTLSKDKIDFLVILFGKLLQAGLSVASIKLMTFLLEPKQMGSIYLFTTIYTFFVLSLISPLGQYINRHTHAWHENKTLFDNLGLYFVYLSIVSMFSLGICWLIYHEGVYTEIPLFKFLILMSCYILLLTLNQTILPILNMLYFRIGFTILTVLTSLGTLIFGYLSIVVNGNEAENWLLGVVLSNAVFMFIGIFVLRKKLNDSFGGLKFQKITLVKFKQILKFVMPLSVATLFMWLQNNGYRIIIEKNIGLAFLGFLGVGMAISGQIAGIFESIVMQYFHPIYYKKITGTTKEKRKEAINNLINTVLPTYFMLAVFLTFFAKEIVIILVDEKYYSAYFFVALGIWVEFFRMTTNLLGNISQSEMNTKKFMFPYVIGSLVTVLLVYIACVGENYQYTVSVALVLGGAVTLLVMYIAMKKLIDFEINYHLLLFAIMLSLPYVVFEFLGFKTESFLGSLLLVGGAGLYFLLTLFIHYKKVLNYGYR